MKKRFLSLVMALAMLLALLPTAALAASFPPQESSFWHNADEQEAYDLLAELPTSGYLVFVYYSDTCPRSERAVPQMADFADEAGIHIYGYNCEGSSGPVGNLLAYRLNTSTLVWPVVLVYNADNNTNIAYMASEFDDLVTALEYCGLYDGNSSGSNGGSSEHDNRNNGSDLSYDDGISANSWEVLRLTNQHRMAMGLAPLSTFDELQMAANQRAEELTVQYNSDHSRPDGSSCFTVLDDYNISYNRAAENIAYGYRSAEAVMDGWLNSPGHRKNIESANLVHLGVGDSSNYWAQDFVGASSCSYSRLSLSQSSVSGKIGQDLEDILEDADITVTASCSRHGSCRLPLIADMCSGYDPSISGPQTITVTLDGASSSFTLTLTSACANHVYDGGEITLAATCTAEGVRTYTCTICGATKTEPVPKAAHTYDSQGFCLVCGERGSAAYEITTEYIGGGNGVAAWSVLSSALSADGKVLPGTVVTVELQPGETDQVETVSLRDGTGKLLQALTDLSNIAGTPYKECSFVMPPCDVILEVEFTHRPITPDASGKPDAPDHLPFRDVSSHWALEGITYVYENHLFSGTTAATFEPDTQMNRAMVVTVLARYSGVDTSGGAAWYSKGQAWSMEQGISDGSNMMGSITREQLATMLYRYAGSPSASGNLDQFPDAGSVSGYAADALRWAVGAGLISGMDGKLNPQGSATRAQVATIMMRFCEL